MQNKSRVFLGLFVLLLFLSVILIPTLRSNGDGLQKLYVQLEARLSSLINKKPYKGPSSLLTQEVVQEESSIVNVVENVSPSVVSIVVKTVNFDLYTGPSSYEEGIGTGFVVDSEGLIVTNSHVVNSGGGEYSVVLKDGTTYEVKKVHLDEINDLAILEIDAKDLTPVSLGDSESLKVGQRAVAIGNALGKYQNTVTVGVISGVAREVTAIGALDGEAKTYENVVQTDAALNPGNSGGPLLNSAGQVIGINVATSRSAENLSFAIPVNTLKPILESFLKEGRIVRPYMGVSYTMITKEVASIRRLPEGAFISRILPDSPASKAGFERGDIVTEFDGIPVNSSNSLGHAISTKKVGDSVEVVIDRSGEEKKLFVKLEEAVQN